MIIQILKKQQKEIKNINFKITKKFKIIPHNSIIKLNFKPIYQKNKLKFSILKIN
jgi:hypothetical protein